MSTPELIHVGDLEKIEVTLLPRGSEIKKVLLGQARTIESVADAFDAECAADALRNVSNALKDMEATRKAVKAPVLALGKRIDDTAKEFAADLETHKTRISRLLGDYEAAERKKQQDAERQAREAERQRLMAAEEAAASGDESAMEDAANDIAEIRTQTAESSYRPSGTAVRETYQFEVTDIEALFKAAPHLCKIEPDNAAIRAAIKKNQNIAGLRIWKEAKSYTR